MEKKTELVFQINADSLQHVTIELEGGLLWDAWLVPISALVELTDGYLNNFEINPFMLGVELTEGDLNNFEISPFMLGIELIASYGGNNSEVL